jgi:alpha-ketoglutarate-dependent sulfate ester dioxygenase
MGEHEQLSNSQIEVRRVAGRLGAEIRGVKLGASLSSDLVERIRIALLEHKVLFFRNQAGLSDSEQEGFAQLFGTPIPHPTVPVADGTNCVLELDSDHGGRANSWHTDVTFVDAYPKASILRAVVVPEAGGDTVWANTAAAYDELPLPLRQLAEQLRALHTNDYDYVGAKPDASREALRQYQEVFVSTLYETEHPVVHVHPETGKRHLLLGHFVKRILGLSTRDSNHLFELLQGHITRLENTVRWTWHPGDVAFWDNRATQHYAVDDYGTARRIMHRVTIAGALAVGVDASNASKTVKRQTHTATLVARQEALAGSPTTSN